MGKLVTHDGDGWVDLCWRPRGRKWYFPGLHVSVGRWHVWIPSSRSANGDVLRWLVRRMPKA